MSLNESKKDDSAWLQETLKWMKNNNRLPPSAEKRNPCNMVSYVACLSYDLSTGEDGFTGKKLPLKLTDDQISKILQYFEISQYVLS